MIILGLLAEPNGYSKRDDCRFDFAARHSTLMLEVIAAVVSWVFFQVHMRLQLRETPPVQLTDANHMLS